MQHRLPLLLTLLAFLIIGVAIPASGKALMPDRHSTGTATWQAAYEAFGTRTAENGTNDERQRANTKDEDPTGLLNEGHRYRDLDAGMFISRDPAGFVDGPNVYAYVRQNPWSAFDPEGLDMLNDINSMGNDWFGFWGGVGSAAGDAEKGLGQLALNLDPATNAWQGIAGKQTGYQKIAAGAQNAYHGFVQAAENLGANAQMNGRTMTESVLDSAANHVDAATKDPNKAGRLAFNTVTTLATGADATLGLLSKSSNAAAATARGTQAVVETEVALVETATSANRVTTPIGELRAAKLKDAHHVIQDASVRDLPGYNTNAAPGIQLQGPANTPGTPHNLTRAVQRQPGGGTYAAERRIGYKSLRESGVDKN